MDQQKIIIVGGGVLGTMHAMSAIERGFSVQHLERERDARGASVRNFGLVWISGRARGPELALALKARARWERLWQLAPSMGFRANGSLTLAKTPAELTLMEQACAAEDAEQRGFSLLSTDEVRKKNPALQGRMLGGLYCSKDAGVEPRLVPRALREVMASTGRYEFLPGREIVGVGKSSVTDSLGVTYRADRIVLCTGAAHNGVGAEIMEHAPLRRVRLQMFETEPFQGTLTTSIADGDSLRYYPAFDLPGRSDLGAQDHVASANHMQLLCQQRLNGSLTIGDTHAYDEPFAFDLDEGPTDYLQGVVEGFLGQALPRIARRWAGVYSQLAFNEHGPVYYRATLEEGVEIVTGPGGRGMTLSPAIAEETFA
jgi:FAD dependent oxidoreductase TIGR03364